MCVTLESDQLVVLFHRLAFMLFNSPYFVISFVVVLLLWCIIPNNTKKPFLLLFDYWFAYSIGGLATITVLFGITVLSYFFGIIMNKRNRRIQAVLFGLFCFFTIGLLFYEKYSSYVVNYVQRYLSGTVATIPVIEIVGVSYYTFSAISYLADIKRGIDYTDHSFIDVAIWISFFPKFIAGPIERHVDFKEKLMRLGYKTFDFERIKRGLLICSYGYFYKIILADRLAVFVENVYGDLTHKYGLILLVTMILYSLQIYFDFCGYSFIAYGISYAMNLEIVRNFDHPYFSASVSEFWQRWHISLSTWLRDYIYIPLGGNRKGKIRQYANILITFIISGAWHGPGLGYLFWGFLHGLYQIIEKAIPSTIRIPKILKRITCFLMVSFAWIFFRADNMRMAIQIVKQMFLASPYGYSFDFLNGSDVKEWCVLGGGLLLSFLFEVYQARGKSLYETVQKRHIITRWIIYYTIILCLIVFGKYGPSYDSANFIYFRY